MHELSITRNIVEIAENHARRANASRVLSVSVVVGDHSGVVPEAMEFCFEACTNGTLLEGARLVIERVPAKGRCGACGAESPIEPFAFDCPACGSSDFKRAGGDELKITEMEVD